MDQAQIATDGEFSACRSRLTWPPRRPEDERDLALAEIAQLFAQIDQNQRPSRDDGLAEAMRIAEALLFAAAEPLDEKDIEKRMPRGLAAGTVLDALKADYASRGVNLVRAGGKWMFRTAADLAWLLATGEGEAKRLSRAALETLAKEVLARWLGEQLSTDAAAEL